jgi:hypothetical protein
MSTIEALVYRFAFDLARRTVIGAGSGEELFAGAWRGVVEGFRAGRELIATRGAEPAPTDSTSTDAPF